MEFYSLVLNLKSILKLIYFKKYKKNIYKILFNLQLSKLNLFSMVNVNTRVRNTYYRSPCNLLLEFV